MNKWHADADRRGAPGESSRESKRQGPPPDDTDVAEAPAPERAPGANSTSAVIPRATYRLQLNEGFTFKDATALIPYLSDLGISHVYCSPYFKARPGSVHGYDVVDHNSLNPEIGTRRDFD